jgi:phytanoyl-CoA hydroxylase
MAYRCKLDEQALADGAPALSGAAISAYQEDGVLVIEDFVSRADCESLRQRALELLARHGPDAPGTVFSTRDQGHAKDRYFQDSANGIGVFFEEQAFTPEGVLAVPLERAANKLGHAMHDLDPVFEAFSHGPRLAAVAQAIGLLDPRIVQSMYIFKQPDIGGEVNCHQDSSYLYTEPGSVVGFWFAIEDAHRGNGCLGGLPGEWRKGLKERFRRNPDGQLRLEQIAQPSWDMGRLEWLEVKQGTLIVFNGQFPHLSEANRSPQSRHAYTLHAVSGQAHYPGDNWIQRRPGVDPPYRGFL